MQEGCVFCPLDMLWDLAEVFQICCCFPHFRKSDSSGWALMGIPALERIHIYFVSSMSMCGPRCYPTRTSCRIERISIVRLEYHRDPRQNCWVARWCYSCCCCCCCCRRRRRRRRCRLIPISGLGDSKTHGGLESLLHKHAAQNLASQELYNDSYMLHE